MSEESANQLFWYRAKFLGLVAVFLLPFIGGWLALYVFEWRPQSGNYGQLVQPVKKVDWPTLEASDGQLLEEGFGRRWVFLVFAQDGCSEQCRENLFYMRQIRTLLGRDNQRLQNVLVSPAPLTDDVKAFLGDSPAMLAIEGPQANALSRQFAVDEQAVGLEPRIYLVDPDSNLMMFYPAVSDEALILDDLRKLLKLSQIG